MTDDSASDAAPGPAGPAAAPLRPLLTWEFDVLPMTMYGAALQALSKIAEQHKLELYMREDTGTKVIYMRPARRGLFQ